MAIVYINCFCILSTLFQATSKITTNSGVHVLDLCFVRTFINFLSAIITVSLSGKHPINDVPKHLRNGLLVRTIVGLIGFNAFVYGVKILPMFIMSIINNTAPFWASILGYFILNEKVSK